MSLGAARQLGGARGSDRMTSNHLSGAETCRTYPATVQTDSVFFHKESLVTVSKDNEVITLLL